MNHRLDHLSVIFLFDGVCNLCHRGVQIVIKNDPEKLVRMGAIQSDAGKRLMRELGLTLHDPPETMILVEGTHVYTESTAALRLAKHLKGPWSWFHVFMVIPRFIRDPIYRFIAKSRYSWFGKQESCLIPTPDIKDRFIH